MKHTLLTLSLLSSCILAQTQPKAKDKHKEEPRTHYKFSAGLGIGIDYGGVGTRVVYSPIKSVFVFGALGYNLVGAGYNLGAGYRFLPDKRFSPYVVGMYGYNTVVTVKDVNNNRISKFDRVFFGPTFGLGGELRRSRNRPNFWSFGILVPIRSDEFDVYKSELERVHRVTLTQLPFAISIGYNIEI